MIDRIKMLTRLRVSGRPAAVGAAFLALFALSLALDAGVRRFGISSIKACLSGSAPLPVEVQEAFERLTRGRLVEGTV